MSKEEAKETVQTELTDSAAKNRHLDLSLPSGSIALGTYAVGIFDGKKWKLHSYGDRSTVHHSLEESQYIKDKRRNDNFKFKMGVWAASISKIMESVIKSIKGS